MNRKLGSYHLSERLGVGGMAEVFAARAHRTGELVQPCVVKVLHSELATDENFVQRLLEEAQLVARLRHNNIASLYDVGEVDGEMFLVMEHVAGRDLHSVLARAAELRRPIPVDFALYVTCQICRGLHFAHTRRDPDGQPLNLVHRDVSPPNVLVSNMGEVKLIDFGIAKFNSDARQKTQSGVIKGKFGYMAPEQAWDEPLDRRTDIFSVGVCLYEMLTGQTLYEKCEDPMTMLRRAREADITPVSQCRDNVPKPVLDIVDNALACERNDRFPWAHHMERALAAALADISPGYTPLDAAAVIDELFDVDEPALSEARQQVPETTAPMVDGVPDGIRQAQSEKSSPPPRPETTAETSSPPPATEPQPDFTAEKTEVFDHRRAADATASVDLDAPGDATNDSPSSDAEATGDLFGGKTQIIDNAPSSGDTDRRNVTPPETPETATAPPTTAQVDFDESPNAQVTARQPAVASSDAPKSTDDDSRTIPIALGVMAVLAVVAIALAVVALY